MVKLKRILSVWLMLALMVGNISVQAMNDSSQENAFWSEARTRFVEQTAGQYRDEDVLDVIVQLKESAFSDLGRTYPATELQSEDNLLKHTEFSQKANEKALAEIQKKGIDLELLYTYELFVLGFSASLNYENALLVANLDFVESVHPVTKYAKPETTFYNEDTKMIHSREIVNQDKIYSQYKGEGTVIAVLDSGFDTDHPAFYISDEFKSKVKLEQSAVEDLVSQKKVAAGVYVNDKFPFAYNYFARNNTNIKEMKVESHGQHVAGTAAANKVEMESGTFMGIAPEAQILAMRVFPDNGGTGEHIYVKAIEDAVTLGADSINMSLGATAGNLEDISAVLNRAVVKATEMGVVMAIAAGNDGQYGKSVSNPKATEPDYGIMSSPAIIEQSLAVASFNNTKIMQSYITLHRGGTTEEIGFVQPGDSSLKFSEEKTEVVNCQLGLPEQIPDEVKGKYALIERGAITFTAKINNAHAKGAKGVIIYNHAIGGNDFISMSAQGSLAPAASIRRDVALRLLENLSEYQFQFSNKVKAFENKSSGYISDFSNWGLSADGDVKPEIMAPGGNIYSTIANHLYGNMSGTSMATPHIAGGIALVKSRVNQDFADYTGQQKYELVKSLLMSTATPHVDLEEKSFSSPRNQGAGIMNLQGALTSNVILLDKQTKYSKIRLNDVDEKFTVSFLVKNLKDTPAKYKIKAHISTDKVLGDYMTLTPRELMVMDGGEITVSGNEEQEVSIVVDSSEFTEELSKKMPNGYFLEGYVILENADEANPQPNLSIPFVGFKGKFNDLRVLEDSVYKLAEEGRLPLYYSYEKDGSFSSRDFTHFFSSIDGKSVILGQVDNFNPAKPQFEKLVLSPNGDKKSDELGFRFTVARNAAYVTVRLYEGKDEGLKQSLGTIFGTMLSYDKNFFSGDTKKPKAYTQPIQQNAFDKAIKADGLYKMVIHSKSIIDASNEQTEVFDLYIDRQAPTLENLKFDEATRTLSFESKDEVSGIKEEAVSFEEGGRTFYLRKEAEGYRIPAGISLHKVKVEITDFGYNTVEVNPGIALGAAPGRLTTNVTVLPVGTTLPSFTQRIVSAEDETLVWKPDKLAVGSYKLFIENIQQGYRLQGENPIVFEITEENNTVEKDLVFEKLSTKRARIQVPAAMADELTVRAVNLATAEEYELLYNRFWNYFHFYAPYGEYQIYFENAPIGIKLVLDGYPNNVLTINDSFPSTVIQAKPVGETERNLVIHSNPEDLQVEYHVYSMKARKFLEEPYQVVSGTYFVFPKIVPQGYRTKTTIMQLDVAEGSDDVEMTYEFEVNPEGTAKVKIVDNQAEYDLAAEYILTDAAAYFGLGGVEYRLKDNPDVPFGNYILKADSNTFDTNRFEMEERDVVVDEAEKEFSVEWKQIGEQFSYLNLQVEMPEDLESLNLQFQGSFKKTPELSYQKNDYKTHSILLRHDQYQVVVKDLPEGYVLKPANLTVVHSGETVLRFRVEKGTANGLPDEYGFGKVVVEVRDQEDTLINDIVTKLYHNDREVDASQALPYGYYEARIKDFDADKYQVLEGRKEGRLEEKNRLLILTLKVKAEIDKTKLFEAIDQAKQIDWTKYSDETVNALKAALESAQKVYDDAQAKQSEVNAEVEKLKKAMHALKEKPAPVPTPTPGNAGPTDSGSQYNPSKPAPSTKPDTVIQEDKVPLGDSGFQDVDAKAWYAQAVRFVKEKALMQGVSSSEFKPNAAVTRGMVMTILYRLEKEPKPKQEGEDFSDVPSAAYYANPIKWASSEKLVLGFGDGTFRPNAEITREQLAHILANYAKYKGKKAETQSTELSFKDKDRIAEYAKDSVAWANEVGILQGRANGSLEPKGKATRAELAKLLQNFVEKVLER